MDCQTPSSPVTHILRALVLVHHKTNWLIKKANPLKLPVVLPFNLITF